MARSIAVALALVAVACTGPEGALVVDVLTNYRPGTDVDGVVIAIHRGDDLAAAGVPVHTSARAPVAPRAGAPAPFRAAEIPDLGAASWLVVARLYRGDAEVARGRVLVTTAGRPRNVTVLVTSECAGVECPGTGDPALVACLAGRCVDPRCTIEAPEHCPAPDCASDGDCASTGPACVRGLCVAGACATFPDDERCVAGACDRALGCVGDATDAGSGDAGMSDAGSDASVSDAGVDAGPPTPAFVEVAAGGDHTCARTAAGEVWCWGRNDQGQLGDGTTAPRSRPTPVVGLGAASALAVGGSHSCAIVAGAVWCWGDGEYGQIGSAFDSGPREVGSLTAPTQIAAGDYHTCALVAGDAVRCWGRGDAGQLGNASTNLRQPSPSSFRAGSPVSALAVGHLHTCVVLRGGAARCAGHNFSGQLGDGTNEAASTPVDVMLPSDVGALGAGMGHTCAVRGGGGNVSCWGENGSGELGDGTLVDSELPVTVVSLGAVLDLRVGSRFACARTGGDLACWGRNDDGQLGDGTSDDRSTPVAVPGTADLVQIAPGGSHACGRSADGRLRCWGDNAYGQLGDGTTTARSRPTPVP